LKCDQGFVGYKSVGSNRLECNKATYETIIVERADKGVVHLKGQFLFPKIKTQQLFSIF
jgi:fascin 1/2